jgi:tetratricopeptide (TPR) repeat protein
MLAAGLTAASLFFVLWWMLHGSGDEAPWLPAGLAASVVMVVAAAARQVVMRRAWTRYILEQDHRDPSLKSSSGNHKTAASSSSKGTKSDAHSVALRAVQKRSAEADASGELPEAHLEAYHLCKDYLSNTEEALRQGGLSAEGRAAVRSGRERVRLLQKHHLLAWASISTRTITQDAQRRVLVWDKIETAQRAIEIIRAALKIYPEERELLDSTAAIEEFISSVKVAHWVELAERSAFKGQYRRAIERYRDALFYASRGQLGDEARRETTERISREIELLRARLKLTKLSDRRSSSTATTPDE